MKKLTKSEILGVKDIKTVDIEVPEWGGSVTVSVMNGTARDAFEESMATGNGKDRKQNMANFRARLAASTLVDESGAPMFTIDEAAALGKKSSAALDRVFEAARKLNRMTPEDVQDLTKNSEPVPSDVSTTV